MGIYPFMFGAIQDFEPVVQTLVAQGQKEPYDWDAYALPFFPKAEELLGRAEEAQNANRTEEACELFLRASAVYRIARFPAPRSAKQREAWTLGKAACSKGLSLLPHPLHEVQIPHTAGLPSEGSIIPAYHHVPVSDKAVPLVIIITGLDGYRTELAVWAAGFAAESIATLILEIPGTGDSPADPRDPTAPDRIFTSVLSWLLTQPSIDPARVVAWGFSTGGYYSLRLAHTHASQLAGAISLGGGCHHMFDPEWLDASLKLEYPFDLGRTLAYKFGYRDDHQSPPSSSSSSLSSSSSSSSSSLTYETFKSEARARFSLVEDGTLDKPCTRMLLVNGTEDEIFPIDDLWVAASKGSPKEVRLVPGTKHMGEPHSFRICLEWIHGVLGVQGADWKRHVATLPFKAKFP